jgi:NAD+ synthase (glutamine-hydrolysing)
MSTLKICLAQLDLFVGDIDGNASRVIATARDAEAQGADLVMFPELALSGYPPEDLLFHSGFRRQVQAAVARVCAEAGGIDVLVGYPEYDRGAIHNSVALVRGGRVYANHRKQCLPNYKVFDEKRYFAPGRAPTLVDVKGARVALLLENSDTYDIWYFAVMALGAVAVPLNVKLVPAEIAFMLQDAGCVLVLSEARFAQTLRGIAPGAGGAPALRLLDGALPGAASGVFDTGAVPIDADAAIYYT